jgi:hypothetical protein
VRVRLTCRLAVGTKAGRLSKKVRQSPVVADCQNGSLVFPLDSGLDLRSLAQRNERVGSNWEARPSKPGWWEVVTNAECEVSEGEGFYREAATIVPDEGTLLQLCDGSQGFGLVAAK